MAKKRKTTKTSKKKMNVSYGVDKAEDVTAEIPAEDIQSEEEVEEVQAEESKPAPKKTLIDEINEMKANGEVDTDEFRGKMTKIESILGVDSINPFGTNELDIFEGNLKGMTTSDLQDLAYKVGINPYIHDSALKANLVKEFKAYNRNNMRNVMPEASNAIKLDPNNPQHAKTIKILGEI